MRIFNILQHLKRPFSWLPFIDVLSPRFIEVLDPEP